MNTEKDKSLISQKRTLKTFDQCKVFFTRGLVETSETHWALLGCNFEGLMRDCKRKQICMMAKYGNTQINWDRVQVCVDIYLDNFISETDDGWEAMSLVMRMPPAPGDRGSRS